VQKRLLLHRLAFYVRQFVAVSGYTSLPATEQATRTDSYDKSKAFSVPAMKAFAGAGV